MKGFCLLFLILFMSPYAFSQTENEEKEERLNPVEIIMQESNGYITIDIPENILELILQTKEEGGLSDAKTGVTQVAGYRIQVFSDGRGQSTLESRAKARGNMIVARFPKYKGQVYTFSSSPNWYTRIGNFKTLAEANSALTELKNAFPGLSTEMRVVKSRIVLLK